MNNTKDNIQNKNEFKETNKEQEPKKANNISERIKNLNTKNEEKEQNKIEEEAKLKEKNPIKNLIQERLKMIAENDTTKKECNFSEQIKVKEEKDKPKEEKRKISNVKEKNEGKVEEQQNFNKELCKKIAKELPTRTQIDFYNLKLQMKSKTNQLSQKEKSYVIFLWICDNIVYDAKSYFQGKEVDCTPEGVYRNGSSVCSGYSRLYKDFSIFLNLQVECVSCYAKGVNYEPGERMNGTNHEYNVISINNKYYPIDSTWGAGHIENQDFVKSFNEFYFFADPELLIKTHFPEDEKWQLTKKKYKLEDFLKWPLVKDFFYRYGFERFYPDQGMFYLKNSNEQKFVVYGNNMSKKTGMCNVYLLQGNVYQQLNNLSYINFYDDKFDVHCIFNKKGKYKIQIFGNKERGQKKNMDILEYVVNVENDAKEDLSFPMTYQGEEDINIVEPKYNNLKSGEKVKFKIKSNLKEIIIIDEQWYYLKKNEEGFFELETVIKSKKGKTVVIGKKLPNNSCAYLASYEIK